MGLEAVTTPTLDTVRKATRGALMPTLEDVRKWPATVSVPEAAKAIGVCDSHAYALAARDEFPCRVIKVGGSRRVVTADLVRLLAGDEPPPTAA